MSAHPRLLKLLAACERASKKRNTEELRRLLQQMRNLLGETTSRKSEISLSRKTARTRKTGIVRKVFRNLSEAGSEQAEIAVDGAPDLFRELRILNRLENDDGKPVRLKAGARVSMTLEADEADTTPENDAQ